MKQWLFSLFGNSGGDNARGANLPWLSTPSIYTHILRHLDPATGRLQPAGEALPDEERRYADSQLRWAPGAMDGAFGRHFGANSNQELAQTIATHIKEIARTNSQRDKIALYTLLLEDNLLDFIDPALEAIVQSGISPEPHLHSFAVFLAQEAPDRGPVKFAIALLGLMDNASDTETIAILGRHEEFTLYAAVALANMLVDPEPTLWDLAQKVSGWGRIHLVERLSTTDSPEIKDWLLRSGYQNSVMYEYLAYTCATGGDLKTALSADVVDDELLDAAGDILEALINGGPAEDIHDYADAADVVALYLDHVGRSSLKLQRFGVVDSIARYLASDSWDSLERAQNGWTDAARTQLLAAAQAILRNPRWIPLVEQGLASSDQQEFYAADRAAGALGIDTWAIHWTRLEQNPRESQLWFPVMRRANHDTIDQIVQLAIDSLPLDEVATGAANELGLGPEFKIHQCLDVIIQDLGAYPAKGWPLLAACLKSPVVRHRNLAVRVLGAWGRPAWTPDMERALGEAHAVEPLPEVQERMGRVLRGEPFDEPNA